jgi:cysteine desulfurase
MPSPVLMAMGYETAEAASGLRISLGPWVSEQSLRDFPQALQDAIEECSIQALEPAL